MTSAHALSSMLSQNDAEDAVLVTRASGGDTHAFSALVARHYDRAMRVAYGFLKSQPEAEDVVQDAFVKVHVRLPEFRADSGFYTWLYRIVVNLSIDRLRRQRRERRVDIEDEDGREALSLGQELWPTCEDGHPHTNLGRAEMRGRLQNAFSSLPEIHQSVLLLREVEGLSYEEIARSLHIKKGTVMSRLFHARRAMQQQLKKMDRQEEDRVAFRMAYAQRGTALALN